jgi:RNA polymerase sigma factor (sigma-70 family)
MLRDQIIHTYAPLVTAIARALPAPADMLEDLESVGLVKLVELAYGWTESRAETFPAYVRMCVKGAMLDELRRYRGGEDEEVADIADYRQTPEVTDLDELTSDLPPQQAKVIELRRQDLTQDQVGKVMGISRQAVSRIENRAKVRMKKLAA